jgi:hypothetical protein
MGLRCNTNSNTKIVKTTVQNGDPLVSNAIFDNLIVLILYALEARTIARTDNNNIDFSSASFIFQDSKPVF